MLILIVYDIFTGDSQGKRRLSKMLTLCKNYGVRVQDSVFECEINCDLYEKLKIDVENLIEIKQDSVIFYRISHDWRRHVERLGIPKSQDLHRDVFII